MTTELEARPLKILTDGGSSEGKLVLAGGMLAAVLIYVGAGETGEQDLEGGWYVEAGFGPCGILMTLPPQVFAEETEALEWIRHQLGEDAPTNA